MSFDAGAITGSLKLDLGGYAHGILEAQALSSVFPAMVYEFMEHPLLALIEVAKEAGEALHEMLEGVSESQHKVALSAEALGVSVEFMDGWGKAAERIGGSADDMGEAIARLSRTAFEAMKDSTSDSAKAFRELGVQLTDGQGKMRPVEAVVRQLADGLHGMEGGFDRSGVAMELFGRGGASTLAFLSQGSAAIDGYVEQLKEMGDLTDEKAAQSAAAFVGLQVDVSHAWQGIKQQLAEPLREQLTPMLQGVQQWIRSHGPEIRQIVKTVAEDIVDALRVVAEVAVFLAEHFDGLLRVLGAAGLGIAAITAVNAIGSITEALVKLVPALEAATVAQASFNAAKMGVAGAGIGAGIGALAYGDKAGTIGGAVGSVVGGFFGQAIIPIPGLGFLIGATLGGLITGGVAHAVASSGDGGGGSGGSGATVNVGGVTVNGGRYGPSDDELARQTGDTVEQYMRTAQTRQAVFGRAAQSLRGGHS